MLCWWKVFRDRPGLSAETVKTRLKKPSRYNQMIHSFVEDKENDEEEERPLYLTQFMERLLHKKARADVIFLVGDKEEVYAHRLILAASSPVFQAMLYPPKDEQGLRSPVKLPLKIKIQDCKPEHFLSLLCCIYTDEVEIDPANLPALIQIAKKYQIEKLQMLCSDYMEKDVSLENAIDLFQMAPDLLGDKEFALAFIRENMEELVATESFLRLSKDRLLLLLQDDFLCVEEVSLFQALLRWGKHQLSQLKATEQKEQKGTQEATAMKEVLSDLLPEIRFAVMETDDIATHVAPSKLLDEALMLKLFQYSVLSEREKDSFDFGELKKTARVGGFMVKESKLLDSKLKKALFKLFDGAQGAKLDLIYRGSRDGFTGHVFHSKCDGMGPTLTVIKPSHNNNIFGGYTEHTWSSTGSYSSQPAWLFSLRNARDDTAYKFLPSTASSHAYNNGSYGPTFGGGHDLHVHSNMAGDQNYTNPSTFVTSAP
eukprot:g58134.t1